MRTPLVLALVLTPAIASAEAPDVEPSDEDAGEVMVVSADLSARSNASGWVVMPDGYEASGELHFLTGAGMSLTDVVVSRASLRRGFGGKLELAGGLDLLPKQPSDTDENVFVSADLGAQYAVGRRMAVGFGVGGGPVLDHQGAWTTGSIGLVRRSKVHDTLSFQLGAGGSYTGLSFDSDDRANLFELTTGLRTLFMIEDAFGLWFNGSFAFPVAHSGTLMDAGSFDPQTRVDVSVGVVYALVDDWDVYMEVGVVDRGDLDAPETMLPVLQGGTDQRVFTFGITRHFGEGDDDGGDYDQIAYE